MDMNIDWLADDGVNLTMINDVVRNSFYDKILSCSVKDKKCCEVGFGTGLLSLLALKHGAVSIIAYEKDPARFALGQKIIAQLNLTDRIQLINASATTEIIEATKCDVIFHEIIHQALWAEGLWYIKPSQSGPEYVPGSYFFEMYATEISDSTVDGFVNGDNAVEYFNPGIDIDNNFINLINKFITQDDLKKIKPQTSHNQLIQLDWNKIHKDWYWNPRHVFSYKQKQLLCKYIVDYNTRKSTFVDSHGTRENDLDSSSICQMIVDTSRWREKNLMLELRFGLEYKNERMYIDDGRNWGAEVPWIFIKPTNNLLFTQNFNGDNYPFQLSKM